MDFIKNIKASMCREIRLIRQKPVCLIAALGTMTFCMVFFLTFLKDGVPGELPIGIVDCDNSSLSRNLTRQIDATQLGKTIRFNDYAQAREALQTGKINAVCVIPDMLYDDVLSGRQPTITFYVNTMYYIGGALAYKDLLTMMNLSAGGVQRELLKAKGMDEEAIMGRIQPIVIDAHYIGNAMTDYRAYLTGTLIPGFLEMTVILVTVFALGSELKYGTSRTFLENAGGSMTAAITGKLIPYTILFTIIGIICDTILYRHAGFPMEGYLCNLYLGTFVMILACEAMAVFLTGAMPVLRTALCISALYSILAFTLAGFTFPVEALPPYIQGLSTIFPFRHFYLMLVQETVFGSGFEGWYPQLVSMAAFMLLPAVTHKRLYKACELQNFPKN